MNIVTDIEKFFEDLWTKLRVHTVPDAEAAAKAVLDEGKTQLTALANQAVADAKQDAGTAAAGAAQVAGDVAAVENATAK